MRMALVVALTGSVVLFGSAIVEAKQANTTPQSPAEAAVSRLKKDCKKDIKKLCKNVSPGEGRIADCLNSKEDQLSTQCRTSWIDAKAKVSRFMDKSDVAFRKECGLDVKKYCSSVPSGQGRLLDCLGQHESSLSDSCKNYQARLQQQLQQFFG